jgi:predicted aspartyl protease
MELSTRYICGIGSVVLEAVLDTGFDGDVCLSTPVAVTIGLELTSAERNETQTNTEKIFVEIRVNQWLID